MTTDPDKSTGAALRRQANGAILAGAAGVGATVVGVGQALIGGEWWMTESGVSAIVAALCLHASWRARSGSRSTMSIEERLRSAAHSQRVVVMGAMAMIAVMTITRWMTHDEFSVPPRDRVQFPFGR